MFQIEESPLYWNALNRLPMNMSDLDSTAGAEFRSQRIGVVLNAVFAPPLFRRSEIPERFFEMVHSSLSPQFAVDLDHLQISSGDSMGDAVATCRIFGGSSTVSISADTLSAQFPMALPGDRHVIKQILFAIGSGFAEKFPESRFARVQLIVHEHADTVSGSTASEYLAQFEMPAISSKFRELNASYTPGACFMVTGHESAWQARCTLEKSLYLADGIFLNYDVTLNQVSDSGPLDVQLRQIDAIVEKCASVLEIGWAAGFEHDE